MKTNQIVVVCEAPTHMEVLRGTLMEGNTGQILAGVLTDAGVSMDDVVKVSLSPVPLKKDQKLTKDEIKALGVPLRQKLIELQPRAVILCGFGSIAAITGGQGPQNSHGQKVWDEEIGCVCVHTYHPLIAFYEPDTLRDIRMDLRNLSVWTRDLNPVTLPKLPWVLVDDADTFTQFRKAFDLHQGPDFLGTIDIETTGLNFRKNRIFSVGISFSEESNWIVTDKIMKDPEYGPIIKEMLERPGLDWAGQNLFQFDLKFIQHQYGIKWKPTIDTMLAHYALDERQTGHGLKHLAQQYFDAPDWSKAIDWDDAENFTEEFLREDVYPYQVYDLYFTRRLVDALAADIRKEGMRLSDVHYDVLVPGAWALGQIEMNGMFVDEPYLDKLDKELEVKVAEALNELQTVASEYGIEKFNPNSPKQVKELILGKLKLKPTLGSGTDKAALESLDHPIAKQILDARVQTKLRSTYVQGIRKKIEDDGRIRADFVIWGTSTGRLCIAKGTEVEVIRNLNTHPKVKIEDVKVGDLVYTYDDEKKLTIRPVVWSGKTGHKKVVRVHWQTGGGRKGFTDMTPDHRVRLVDGTYQEAQKLTKGTQVLALARGMDEEGGYQQLFATRYPEAIREHRFIHQTLTGEIHQAVHHVDGQKSNNLPSNLEGMTKSQHSTLHGKEFYLSRTKHLVRFGPRNLPEREWMVSELWRTRGKPTVFTKEHGIDYTTAMKYLQIHGIDWKKIASKFNHRGEPLEEIYVRKARKIAETQGMRAAMSYLGVDHYKFKSLQEEMGYIPYNHKIVSVEPLEETVDVYDLEVEDTHNFIAGEICVHNSSRNPNMQNIPSLIGPLVKKMFTPSKPGWSIMNIDYSQLELRVAGWITGDDYLTGAYKDGKDLHTLVAASMYQIDPSEVTKYQRYQAKFVMVSAISLEDQIAA